LIGNDDINVPQSFSIKFHKNWTRCPNGTTWYMHGFLLSPFLVHNMKMCFFQNAQHSFFCTSVFGKPWPSDAFYNIMQVRMPWIVVFSTNVAVSFGTVELPECCDAVVLWMCLLRCGCCLEIWKQALVYGFDFIREKSLLRRIFEVQVRSRDPR
jgi:hypothetical protein